MDYSGGVCVICEIDETIANDKLISVKDSRRKLIRCSKLRHDCKDNILEKATNLTVYKLSRNEYTKPQNIKKALKQVCTYDSL